MAGNKWLVFIISLGFWALFFYGMDRYLMSIQGLPVGADLMPV